MNILILTGSPRRGGNTDLLAEAFVKGASTNHRVDIVSVGDYKVNPCMGCNACFKNDNNTCCQKDDMPVIYNKLAQADMLVIASPVYFYGLSAQLKTIIDRCHNHPQHIPHRQSRTAACWCRHPTRTVRQHFNPISALPEFLQHRRRRASAGARRKRQRRHQKHQRAERSLRIGAVGLA